MGIPIEVILTILVAMYVCFVTEPVIRCGHGSPIGEDRLTLEVKDYLRQYCPVIKYYHLSVPLIKFNLKK